MTLLPRKKIIIVLAAVLFTASAYAADSDAKESAPEEAGQPQEELNASLSKETRAGNMKLMIKLLKEGAQADSTVRGVTPMKWAYYYREDADQMRILIFAGATLDSICDKEESLVRIFNETKSMREKALKQSPLNIFNSSAWKELLTGFEGRATYWE